jgi:hypothetical protein
MQLNVGPPLAGVPFSNETCGMATSARTTPAGFECSFVKRFDCMDT